MGRKTTALILGLGCLAVAGCGTGLIDDILGAGGPSGGHGGATGVGGTGGMGGMGGMGGTGGAGGAGLGQRCGGNIANPPQCPAGFECTPDPANGNLPAGDVGGICVKISTPVQHCGGFAGLPCPGGGNCVDDPSDSCNPAAGGADCGGVCRCVQRVLCVKGAVFDSSPQVCACVLQTPPPSPPLCGPVCQIFCPYGNVIDASGCPTCACNLGPPPTSTACAPDQCTGPAPKSVTRLCPDGITVAGPACVLGATGVCAWAVLACPATPN